MEHKRSRRRGERPACRTLRKVRREREVTQRQLGDAIGVTQALVGLVESGRRSATPRFQREASRFFGVPREELFPEVVA